MDNAASHIDPRRDSAHDMIRAIDECHERILVETKQLQTTIWQNLAGVHLARMLQEPGRAAEYLSHANPDLRYVALTILTEHFGLWVEMKPQCERMASGDIDPLVRLLAKMVLVRCYYRTNDTRAKRTLAEIVVDESQSDEMRWSCYVMLMDLHDKPLQRWPKGFPGDIDWEGVMAMVDWETVTEILRGK